MKIEQMMNLNVVDVSQGATVGTVHGLLIDPMAHRVEAIAVSTGGLLTRPKYVLFTDVVAVENDVVTIPNEGVLHTGDEFKPGLIESLTQRHVITEDGRQLGDVRSYEIDPRTGDILTVTFGVDKTALGGLWKKAGDSYTIPIDLVRTLGENVVVSSDVPEVTGMGRAA